MFFGAGPCVKILMKLGFMPKETDFYELTPKQYQKYYSTNEDTHERLYALLPSTQKVVIDEIGENDVAVFTEQNIDDIMKAEKIIDSYCKDATYPLPTDEDKLRYAAARLPDVFSKGSKFENAAFMDIK